MILLDVKSEIEARLIGECFTFEFEHGEECKKEECDFTINSVETEIGNGEVRLEARAHGHFVNDDEELLDFVVVVVQFLSMEQLELEIEELDGELEVE